GQPPDPRTPMRGTPTSLAGVETPFSIEVLTGKAGPHVILNEVLANPLGAEPAEEWVEVVNDGTAPVDLTGFSLELSEGPTLLPAATLKPGPFALVVAGTFETNDGRHVPPAASTLI